MNKRKRAVLEKQVNLWGLGLLMTTSKGAAPKADVSLGLPNGDEASVAVVDLSSGDVGDTKLVESEAVYSRAPGNYILFQVSAKVALGNHQARAIVLVRLCACQPRSI